jgi:hypothetical protein
MYAFKNKEILKVFTSFGYPIYIIYPLAFLKTLGVTVLWFSKIKWLKEWAYAGLFFNFVLTFFAHFMISDGEQSGALKAIIFLITAYIFSKKSNKF